jgi:hypothetical protein
MIAALEQFSEAPDKGYKWQSRYTEEITSG